MPHLAEEDSEGSENMLFQSLQAEPANDESDSESDNVKTRSEKDFPFKMPAATDVAKSKAVDDEEVKSKKTVRIGNVEVGKHGTLKKSDILRHKPTFHAFQKEQDISTALQELSLGGTDKDYVVKVRGGKNWRRTLHMAAGGAGGPTGDKRNTMVNIYTSAILNFHSLRQ